MAKMRPSQIAALSGRDVRTIHREIKTGLVHRIRTDLSRPEACNADRAQDVHD
jgi:hypothetical protein